MKSLSFASFGLLLLIAGCSSSTSSPGANSADLSATVGGVTLHARSAIARYGTVSQAVGNGTSAAVRGLTITISDKPNTCATFHGQGSTNLIVTIPDKDAAPRAYPIVHATTPNADSCEVDFDAVDASCHDTVAQPATGGTVTLKDVVINLVGPGDSIVSGTIDATFAGGHVAGDFDAILCPDEDAAAVSAGSPSPMCAP